MALIVVSCLVDLPYSWLIQGRPTSRCSYLHPQYQDKAQERKPPPLRLEHLVFRLKTRRIVLYGHCDTRCYIHNLVGPCARRLAFTGARDWQSYGCRSSELSDNMRGESMFAFVTVRINCVVCERINASEASLTMCHFCHFVFMASKCHINKTCCARDAVKGRPPNTESIWRVATA